MARKAAERAKCALCGAKDVTDPHGDEKYCRSCWDKKIAVEEIVAKEFALKRYIRAHSAEKYLIYHSTQKRPCGQLIVIDDSYDLFLTLILSPAFSWTKGDPLVNIGRKGFDAHSIGDNRIPSQMKPYHLHGSS